MIFPTQVNGIPCKCHVDFYSPTEPEKFHFTVLGINGHEAKWLQAKVTRDDRDRLIEEFKLEALAIKYGKEV
jgi:hypothetical protein